MACFFIQPHIDAYKGHPKQLVPIGALCENRQQAFEGRI